MADEFDLNQESSPSDALSDVTTGMNIALLAMIMALAVSLVVVVSLFIVSSQKLDETRASLIAEQAAKQAVQEDLKTTQKRVAEAKTAEKRARRAANEAANQALSDQEIDALASLKDLRSRLKREQDLGAQQRSEIVRLTRDLADAEGRAAAAAAQAATADKRASKAEARAEKCEAAKSSGGDPKGKLVDAGLKIYYNDAEGIAMLVRTADEEEAKAVLSGERKASVQYVCSKDVSGHPYIYYGGFGGGLRSGGGIGR
jgi:membrane-associated HD superfamily phosphohydrolase